MKLSNFSFLSFRGDAKHRTRNLEIPGSRRRAPRNDVMNSRLRRMNKRPRTGLGILRYFDGDEVGPAVRQRFLQRRAKGLRRCHADSANAEGFRKLDEIRIDEVSCHHAPPATLALIAPHLAVA